MNRNQWRDKSGRNPFYIFATRVMLALLVVCATWNPSGLSFLSWLGSEVGTNAFYESPLEKIVLGTLLLVGWVILIWTTYYWMGMRFVVAGAVLIPIVFFTLQWLVTMETGSGLTLFAWTVLAIASVLLGYGASGRHMNNLKRRLDEPRRR